MKMLHIVAESLRNRGEGGVNAWVRLWLLSPKHMCKSAQSIARRLHFCCTVKQIFFGIRLTEIDDASITSLPHSDFRIEFSGIERSIMSISLPNSLIARVQALCVLGPAIFFAFQLTTIDRLGAQEVAAQKYGVKDNGGLVARSEAAEVTKADGVELSLKFANWLNVEGRRYWGEPPARCDDMLLARRLYLDLLGRVPSVAEIRDYLAVDEPTRRAVLIDQLVFHQGPRAVDYRRTFSEHWARQWRRVMLPPGTQASMNPGELEGWMSQRFSSDTSFDLMMASLVAVKDPNRDSVYFRLSQSSPATYAANVSRVMLGVRLECAQCHDHPFTEWKQADFWGLAAFYSDMGVAPQGGNTASKLGTIENEGVKYFAKYLWQEPLIADVSREKLAAWLTSPGNRQFSSVSVNRFWQLLVGRGVFASVDDLDLASPKQRELLDALAVQFAENKFPVRSLIAAICKSDWYQAVASEAELLKELDEKGEAAFCRPLKSLSPEQVFDSLEQALMLPISRLDPSSARWTGERAQMVSRLGESVGKSPEEYASGIPQALVMMNGKLTADAISVENSRLLRAALDSPFMSAADRIDTLCLATLSRHPTEEEFSAFMNYINKYASLDDKRRAHGEILWALVNSPEFVLCR